VAIRAPCCKRWFDCPECHKEVTDHELQKTDEMVFACKKCKKVFRKNMRYVLYLYGVVCCSYLSCVDDIAALSRSALRVLAHANSAFAYK
jgi:uncharacterized CHY-type Zn-finger protein